MHEAALARQLLEATLGHVEGAARVTRVRGWLAETEALSADSLQLHFDAQATGTAAEGAVLELAIEHVRARCEGCGETYLPEHHLTLCPACGSVEGTLLGRVGLGIDAIDLSG